ncbi:peptidylprolyl isomerase [Rhizobium sp. TRM95796]|uniref:peptidylprolyl isomerase n=1 Tax=Rhizobium sp. TRM95796 TaxID=2979862 RepID=UPI0021E8D40A|nr:peptidylprolyl isomerase [Rhizobium sp. TRM95796]MCV3767375.1 peptidylprolyl isomerase [Rhizobium sp. TRM95796]
MFRKGLLAATALTALLIVSNGAFAEDAANPVIATVDGVDITKADLDLAESNIDPQLSQLPPEQKRLAALSSLIDAKLIAVKAKGEKLDETPEFKERVAFIVDRELHNAYFKKHVVDAVTDADVQTRYDAEIKAMPKQEEVRARHILVKTEDEAKAVIKALGEGKDFAELAKEKSTDPNKSDGGDLGYFRKGQMVPEFETAAFAMQKGEVSKAPIKTQFGWHVIKVEDKRIAPPPPLEQVKDQIRQIIMRDKYLELIKTSKDAAKIEVKDPALAKGYEEANKPAN